MEIEILTAALREILPAGVAVRAATLPVTQHQHHDHKPVPRAQASAKRRVEFATGRSCARLCLQDLMIPEVVPGRDPSGVPIWPAGVVGSITHSGGFAAAAATHKRWLLSLGLDIEQKVFVSDDVASLICSATELDEADRLEHLERSVSRLIYFCAKEAFYKCYYPLRREYLDFLDVKLDLTISHAGMGSFSVQASTTGRGDAGLMRRVQGRWTTTDQCVAASAYVVYEPDA